MLLSRINQQIFAKLPDVRQLDINVALDMFKLEHNMQGVEKFNILDLTDYDSTTKSIALSSDILQVFKVFLNETEIPFSNYDQLNTQYYNAYYLGEDSILYLNFDIDTTIDEIKLQARFQITDIADYPDKWLAPCIHFVFKEIYTMKQYYNLDQFLMHRDAYDRLIKSVGSMNKSKTTMAFMEDNL